MNGEGRPLTSGEKRLFALLGMPTLAFALTITLITTYLPVVAEQFTGSATLIGLIIGAEGAVALVLPFIVGAWSDQLSTRLGRRLPFLIAAAPVMAGTVAVLGGVGSLWVLAILVFLFFCAYYVGYEPYRAVYPDVLDDEVAGRAQSSQAIFRGVGTGLALIGGGLLFSISPLLPFLVFGVLTAGIMAEFIWGMLVNGLQQRGEEREDRSAADTFRRIRDLLAERAELRAYLVANSLWELSLAALKTFVILFLTIGVGLSMLESVAVVGVAAVFVLIAGATAGKLGDRFGKARVMTVVLWVYGIGLSVPLFTQEPWIVLPTLPFTAFAGGAIMALPYAVLIPLMPRDEHGLLTGFYSATRGIGILVGPILAGAAIMLLREELESTGGYAAMWLVASAAILTSIPYMKWLRSAEARRERSRAGEQPATA